ncbi:hypothetical protein [Fischerella sp. PCC 9605]|uniref:hypothetical protein n=1 Tax=Fischerella sp. PCC 9605 TaxID=1173024 RepID=UPI0004B1AB04|nr:hypothetical protein [Fischerella sp. PCC 9605]
MESVASYTDQLLPFRTSTPNAMQSLPVLLPQERSLLTRVPTSPLGRTITQKACSAT